MSTAFQYDLFLSHNAVDNLRVRRLAERLRAAGLGWDSALENDPVARNLI